MFSLLVALVVPHHTTSPSEEVVLHHVSTSYMADVMRVTEPGQGLLPKEVTWSADAMRNVVTLAGPTEKVQETKQLLFFLDVKPRRLHLVGYVELPMLDREWSVDTTLYNNETWSTRDVKAGFEISLRPQLTNSGTIKLNLNTKAASGAIEATTVVKSGQAVFVRQDGTFGVVESGDVKALVRQEAVDPSPAPRYAIKVDVLD